MFLMQWWSQEVLRYFITLIKNDLQVDNILLKCIWIKLIDYHWIDRVDFSFGPPEFQKIEINFQNFFYCFLCKSALIFTSPSILSNKELFLTFLSRFDNITQICFLFLNIWIEV